tara:strand:- start:268 stop:453 length:186 start_codon:yes stop_codon:yes gene_type:complete
MKKHAKAIASAIGSLIALAVAMGVAVPEPFQQAETLDLVVTLVITALGAFGVTWLSPKNSE